MPVTKAVCGHNIERHAGAAAQGSAPLFWMAILVAAKNFVGVCRDVDKSLKQYAAQPCPKSCPIKTPKNPKPKYFSFKARLSYLPPKPPQRPRGEWTCIFSIKGKVEFDCDGEEGDVQP